MPDASGSVSTAVGAAAGGASSIPTGSAPQSIGTPDSRRASIVDKGMPYYDKIRKDLREMLQRKKVLDRNLSALEDQISKFEASYLEDTPNGNIIRGFDNYIKGTAARRRNAIGDADRVFSMSSATSLKVRPPTSHMPQESSSQSQNASASTPSTDANQKPSLVKKKTFKRRKGEDESESPSEVETPGPKRVRISFSRQPT
ncbi:histone acetyltransferase subunit NuA4-domain-containing protein [Kalaharituber pfeilii]|nr:histone acetyltransferase subunit NuA4-domain-containing protein [Kalaharituber pfeilii]